MNKDRKIITGIFGIFALFGILFAVEYWNIWNEWSLFIPNDEKMRGWVDQNKIVQTFKEKHPDFYEEILPYSGTRHYWMTSKDASLNVALDNDGNIKWLNLQCSGSEQSMCATSVSNYECNEQLDEEQTDKMVSFIENNKCVK